MASNKNNRYRNPANDLVDMIESGSKKTLKKIRDAAQNSTSAWQAAANRTGDRVKEETSKDRSLKAEAIRSRQPAQPEPKPVPKPKPKAEQPKPKPKAEQPKPEKPAKPAATKPKPKPIPKAEAPSSKSAPKSSETYRDGGQGLYQGSQEYRDKVGGSGNPLLNRLRRDMGRDEKTGEKPNAIPKANDKPATKASTSGTGNSGAYETNRQSIERDSKAQAFNLRNVVETSEQRRRRLAKEGRA